ncbi:MAG TPA: hypothetical protein P5256_07925, partial [Beijerinckiaceae bacterium]|nr:hypothetical protein [Beijerinckiaceae bacterium]
MAVVNLLATLEEPPHLAGQRNSFRVSSPGINCSTEAHSRREIGNNDAFLDIVIGGGAEVGV